MSSLEIFSDLPSRRHFQSKSNAFLSMLKAVSVPSQNALIAYEAERHQGDEAWRSCDALHGFSFSMEGYLKFLPDG